jgi:hypothetical protein
MKLSLPQRSQGRPRTQTPEIRTAVITSDWHCPEVDIPTYRAVLNFIRDRRPQYHFINGDFIDAYELSSFDKDPRRFGQTADELEMAGAILDELAEASPTTITKFLYGNHCERIVRRLNEHPELLAFFTKAKDPNEVLAQALNLEERGIEWFPYPYTYDFNGFVIQHGGKGLGGGGVNPSKSAAEKAGKPGVQGHWHKHRHYQVKSRSAKTDFWTMGAMCKLDPDYCPFNDWSNSFGYLEEIVGTDIYTFHDIAVEKGRFVFQGKLYDQDGAYPCR